MTNNVGTFMNEHVAQRSLERDSASPSGNMTPRIEEADRDRRMHFRRSQNRAERGYAQ